MPAIPSRPWSPAAVLLGQPKFVSGLLLVLLMVGFCFLGPVFYHGDLYGVRVGMMVLPPSAPAPLGTDGLGRDVLERLMIGGQRLLFISFSGALAAALIGTVVGVVAGFFGGGTDAVLMRLVDAILGLPQLIPFIFLTIVARVTPLTMTVIVALTAWPAVARVVRASVIVVRRQLFIESALALGTSSLRILVRHVLPNVWRSVLVTTTDQVGVAAILLATAAYLGFGFPPPVPNWSGMVADGMSYALGGAWWLVYFPGAALALLGVGIFLLGDGLRRALDPRQRGRRA